MKKILVLFLLAVICSPASAQVDFQEVKQDLLVEYISNDSIEMKAGIRIVFADKADKNKEDVFNKADNGTGQLEEICQGFEGNVTLGDQLAMGDYGLSRLKLDLSADFGLQLQR